MQEHFGTEPPDEPGWTYAGAMRWTKDDGKEVPDKEGVLPTPTEGSPLALRVAVVGGGPGGLFTAYILNQRMPTAKVTIFEASDRLGGKIDTAQFSDGTPFEAGVAELYEYKGPTPDPLRVLIEEDLGLATVNIEGGAVVLRDEILRDLDEVEEEHGRDTRTHISAFHRKVADLMPIEQYAQRWQPDNSHPWANKTFRECIEEEVTGIEGIDNAASSYIETSVHSDLATESWTCNGLNGIKNVLMDNDEYMQLYHVTGGIEQIVDRLLDKINAKIRTNCRVTGISKTSEGTPAPQYEISVLKVTETKLKERTRSFDAVIVCLPNHWLRTITWSGSLAAAIHSTVAHYDLPAHYLRVSMLFETKWWDKLHIPGEFWMMDICNGCCCYDESTRWAKRQEVAPPHHSTAQPRHEDGKFKDGKPVREDVITEPAQVPEGASAESPSSSSLPTPTAILQGNQAASEKRSGSGYVLSFLLAGGDALLLVSSNQDDEEIVEYVLQSLPPSMRQDAEDQLVEARVDRYVGSINAQPGGWPSAELRGEHQPEPSEHPGIFLVGDYLFDSTLNAALMSANTAVELLLEHFEVESAPVTSALQLLEAKEVGGV